MKKFVAIALVLAMASMANAGIGFVASATEVTSGGTVTIMLKATAACNGFNFDAIDDGDVVGAAADIVWGAGLTQLMPGYIENGEKTGSASGVVIDYAAAYATTNAIAAGVTMFSFTYTAPTVLVPTNVTIAPLAAGVVFHSVLDNVDYTATASTGDLGGVTTPIDGVTILVTPEPMTLGLLGLGGLFLRRRLA